MLSLVLTQNEIKIHKKRHKTSFTKRKWNGEMDLIWMSTAIFDDMLTMILKWIKFKSYYIHPLVSLKTALTMSLSVPSQKQYSENSQQLRYAFAYLKI